MPYTYEYPHPAVSVDIVVFTVAHGELEVLLVKRANWPHAGLWALPGGFVEIDESLKRAAWRELREETGVHAGFLEQLHTYGRPDRDPRERVITVAYLALVPSDRLSIRPGSDAKDARLFSTTALPELAFDHAKILARAMERLQHDSEDAAAALRLMPAAFTMSELQRTNEQITGTSLDKRNFQKKMRSLGRIVETGAKRREGPHRPAKLYRVKGISVDVSYP